jgi:hypothetical protein
LVIKIFDISNQKIKSTFDEIESNSLLKNPYFSFQTIFILMNVYNRAKYEFEDSLQNKIIQISKIQVWIPLLLILSHPEIHFKI